MLAIEIQHNTELNQFSCELDGHQAVLKYAVSQNGDKKQLDFYSTFVPPEFRGKGIAEKLVRTGIAWAKREGFEVHASCWYAAKFLKT